MNAQMKLMAAGLFLFTGLQVAAAEDIVIAPAQETVIREYVRSKPIASVELPGVQLSVGSTVPETVELHRIEAPDVVYDYTVVGGRTYVVEPRTRKIVTVID